MVDLSSNIEPALSPGNDTLHPSNLPIDDEGPQLDPLTPARASPSQQAPLPPPPTTTEQPSFYDLPDSLTLKVYKNNREQLTCAKLKFRISCHWLSQASSKFHEEGSHGSPQEASETHTEKNDSSSHTEAEGQHGYEVVNTWNIHVCTFQTE